MSHTFKTGTYIGRRTTTKHTLAHFWKFDDGKELGWKKNPALGAQIGDVYEFVYEDEHLKDRPKKIATTGDPALVLEWVGLDSAHYQHDVDRRMERRIKERKTEFDEAIAPLQRMVAAVRNHDDRAALIARVTATLWRRTPL
jgi:hypothetical protein